jgi:hypothetical protein
LVFDKGTNVGIGTASPQGILHLSNGDVIPGATDLVLARYWAGPTNVRGSSVFHYYDSTVKDILAFGVAGDYPSGISYGAPNALSAAKMVIQPRGNVGIGTATPAAELDVVGNINSSGSVSATSFFLGSGAGLTNLTAPISVLGRRASTSAAARPRRRVQRPRGTLLGRLLLAMAAQEQRQALLLEPGR